MVLRKHRRKTCTFAGGPANIMSLSVIRESVKCCWSVGFPSLELARKAGGACLARKGNYAFRLQKFTEQRKMTKAY